MRLSKIPGVLYEPANTTNGNMRYRHAGGNGLVAAREASEACDILVTSAAPQFSEAI